MTVVVNLPLVTTATNIQSATNEYQDAKGNRIVVPGGFKVVTSLATIADAGIVIEDSAGNQFVWIPIGTITKADGSKVTIELGRYTFDSAGIPTLHQSATNYKEVVTIESYFQELTVSRVGNSTTNATAINLAEFINKSISNGGYYLARYEASGGTAADSKAAWPTEYIEQYEASARARAKYSGNSYVVSDLVNSYMWDTAIVFIQKCSTATNFSNFRDHYKSKYKCGSSGSVYCNIYDMVGNMMEWTTETTLDTSNPFSNRGSFWRSDTVIRYTKYRGKSLSSNKYDIWGYRVGLYVL